MKISALHLSTAALAAALAMTAPSTFAQNYYKWVDAKGSTHYTTTPPPNAAKKKGKVETYGWKNSAPTPSSAQKPAGESTAEQNSQPAAVQAAAAAAQAAAASKETPPANAEVLK